ncbi:mechanosensitive ion channel family protein [Idiomarina tyrosinivorans]|nr:mechanosensitive ion channel domain-containing protein [Idiomarina tyrosinivorans]
MESVHSVLTAVVSWMSYELFKVGETGFTVGGMLRVVAIVLLAWFVSRVLQSTLARYARHRESFSSSSLYTLQRLMHYALLLIGVMIAISSLGIDLTKFALFASALGVGVGFGLQNLISNFTAGLMLLFEKTLKVGDFIELESGVTGEVKEINIRSTIITTNDNIDIVVPNSQFVDGRVTNWTMRDTYRRVKVKFGVAYGSDKEKVREAVIKAAENVPHTLVDDDARKPQVWLVEFGESALYFELVVWLTPDAVKRPSAVHAALMWEIHTALNNAGIPIPFPQRDIHVRSWSPQAKPPAEGESNKTADGTAKNESISKPVNDAAQEL